MQGWELLVGSSEWLWKEAQSFVRPAAGTVTYKKWPALETIFANVDKDADSAAYSLWNIRIISHLSHCCWSDLCPAPSEDLTGRCSPDWSWPISVWTGRLGSIHRGPLQTHMLLETIQKTVPEYKSTDNKTAKTEARKVLIAPWWLFVEHSIDPGWLTVSIQSLCSALDRTWIKLNSKRVKTILK